MISAMFMCSSATRLISDACDRRLAVRELVTLRFHVTICPHCRRYRQQLAVIQRLVQLCTGDHLSPEAVSASVRRVLKRQGLDPDAFPRS